jgi:hypothetical protein
LRAANPKGLGKIRRYFILQDFTFIERALNVALDVSADIVISVREEIQKKEYGLAVDKIIKKRCEKK